MRSSSDRRDTVFNATANNYTYGLGVTNTVL